MFNKSIIILAAGAGTRMKTDTQRCYIRFHGKTQLYYSIKEALKLSDITVVLYHQAQRAIS